MVVMMDEHVLPIPYREIVTQCSSFVNGSVERPLPPNMNSPIGCAHSVMWLVEE